jgi:hypothetical protein
MTRRKGWYLALYPGITLGEVAALVRVFSGQREPLYIDVMQARDLESTS